MAVDLEAQGLAARALSASQALKKSARPEWALFGDSRAWLSHVYLANAAYPNTYIQNCGMAYHLTQLTGGRVSFPQDLDFGVASADSEQLVQQTYTQIAADPVLTPQAIAVAAYPNKTPLEACLSSRASGAVMVSTTNDRPKWFTTERSKKAAATAIRGFVEKGKLLIVLTEMPRGDATFTSLRLNESPVKELSRHLDVANWLRSLRIPGVYVVDPWTVMALPSSLTGDAIVGMTRDGIHPSFTGQYKVCKLIAEVLNNLYPPYNLLRSTNSDLWSTDLPSGALNDNPMLLGAAGATRPTSWSHAVPAGCALGYGYDSGGRLTIALTGTPTAATPKYVFFQSISPAKVSAGDRLQCVSDIQVAAGAYGYTELSLQQQLYLANNSAYADFRAFGATTAYPSTPNTETTGLSGAYGGVHITEPGVVPSGGIGSSSQMRIEAVLTQNVAVNLPLSIGATDCRKVS